jgi:hypothetical protein
MVTFYGAKMIQTLYDFIGHEFNHKTLLLKRLFEDVIAET